MKSSHLESLHDLTEQRREVQPVPLAKLGLDQVRAAIVILDLIVAVEVVRLVRRRQEHSEPEAQKAITSMKGAIKLLFLSCSTVFYFEEAK